MITSSVDICNMALDYIGEKNIVEIDEKTKQAEKCAMWYDTVRKSLLCNLNASFSIKRACLAYVADHEPLYGYKRAYALPSDCLQVLNLGSPVDDNYYQIEGNYFYCDEEIENVYIRYIADVEEVTKFDADFCKLFALKLAEEICYPLTHDKQQTQLIKQMTKEQYVETSTKYGRDNRVIVINKPQYRGAKVFSEIKGTNYPAR